MNPTTYASAYALLLLLVGFVAYGETGAATALIGCGVGGAVLSLAILALMREGARRQAMRAACALMFMMLIASGARLGMALARDGKPPLRLDPAAISAEDERRFLAVGALAANTSLSLLATALMVNSFVAACRAHAKEGKKD